MMIMSTSMLILLSWQSVVVVGVWVNGGCLAVGVLLRRREERKAWW